VLAPDFWLQQTRNTSLALSFIERYGVRLPERDRAIAVQHGITRAADKVLRQRNIDIG
jgi:hypothetical protein